MSEGESTYLDEILEAKRQELERVPARNVSDKVTRARLEALPPVRDFAAALRVKPGPRAIAEFKRASPSEGTIRKGADPKHISALYVDAGAACISCLCDARFRGSLDDLRAVRASVSVPILCKDFILSRRQIMQAREAGADAVLLIVAALEAPMLRDLLLTVREVGMSALVEAHDGREVERALAAGAEIIGVNARDLRTFEVDLQRCIDLRKSVPDRLTYVAESGITSREDVDRLRQAGVDAVLVGTHLMRAEDPGLALSDLMAPP